MANSEFEEIELAEVALVNEKSIAPKKVFDWINYTDISSVSPHLAESPAVVPSDQAPGRARRLLSPGDTVISTVRPNRRSFFMFNGEWERAVCSTGFVVVSPKAIQDADYLYAALTTQEATSHYESICEGGAYPAFNGALLNEMTIPWPQREKRESIGQLSKSIREKIRVNLLICKNLEETANAIFKAWFVDFEPTSAKAAGTDSQSAKSDLLALFPSEMTESELGLIPSGWGVAVADELFEMSIGRTPPRKESEWFCSGEDGVPWVSIRDMGTYGVYSASTSEGLSEDAVSKFRVPIVSAETVLMSFKLTVGKLCITDRPVVTNEAIAHFSRKGSASPSTPFTYLWLKNFDVQELDSTSSIATATNSSQIKLIRFVVPNAEVAQAFDSIVQPLFDEIRNLTREIARLSDLRDSLLPRLIYGEDWPILDSLGEK